MEHTSDLVLEGKLVHESSYPQRSNRYEEVELDGIKIDYYDRKNRVIHEIKKSNAIENAHELQLKYYIYIFERNGIDGVEGVLEYPLLRKKVDVILSDIDRDYIKNAEKDIKRIIGSDECPALQRKGICGNCSYFEFCFSNDNP